MSDFTTIDELREFFCYCPDKGIVRWLKSPSRIVKPGAIAGRHCNGYLFVIFKGKKLRVHRIAFALTHGRWPEIIDHVNGIKDDNRLCNLRECTHEQNMQNSRVYLRRNKSSRFSGVSRCNNKSNPWTSQIRVDGKKIHLGSFSSELDAHKAYLAAKAELHKFQPTPREAQV